MFTGFPRGRWVAIGEFALVVVVLVGIVAGVLRSGVDIQALIGRFHPLVVHLPIGFLLLTAIVELLARTARYAAAARLLPPMLTAAAIASVVAVVTGMLLSGSDAYEAGLVGRHQTAGILLAVAAAVAAAAAWLRATSPGRLPQLLFGGSFAASLVLLGVTGHFGGSLTHGETYLTEHMPRLSFFTRATATEPAGPVDLGATPVFATLVAPTLNARCVQCHGPSKQSGGLRLDSPDAIREGGESGPVLVAGDAARSEIVRRLFLPASDAKVMPPRGHAPPSHAQVALLRWWIDKGASFEQSLADARVSPELEPAVVDAVGPVDFDAPAILSVRVAAADTRAIDAAVAGKLRVEPLRAGTSLLLVQAPPAARGFSDADLPLLAPLATQIAWLDLGGTAVSDEGLSTLLPTLTNLWKLSLDRTAITDRTLESLGSLDRLETINVYATGVTDAGVGALGRLPRLRSVYAWQTLVTPQGAEALQSSSGATVTLGATAGDPARNEQPAPQR